MGSGTGSKLTLILLLVFVAGVLAATVACVLLMPYIVNVETNCKQLDPANEQLLTLTAPSGAKLAIHLNVNKTTKKISKYYHCSGTTEGLTATPQEGASCTKYSWNVQQYINSVTDCIDLGSQHWFGGSILWNQKWPLNGVEQGEAPYVPGDVYQRQYGGVMERFWISSGGFAVFVEDSVPLLVQMKQKQLCISGSQQASRHYNLTARMSNASLLAYTICSGKSARTLYESLHLWERPSQTPERDLFTNPIWSTWAYLKQNISSASVLSFARNVSDHSLACSQIEIDDKWSTNYGDHVFDAERFPDVPALVQSIHELGYNVTLWVHPFVNNDTQTFTSASEGMAQGKPYLVAVAGNGSAPAISDWWRGNGSALVDVTSTSGLGTTDLTQKLQALLDLGIDSFKFDGGETNWIPQGVSFEVNHVNPGWYTFAWSRFSYEMDRDVRRQETRIGFRAQQLPILVRTMDKDSHWGLDNGLKAVVTSALTHCLIGYNFFLPDMIGGNAYCNDTGLEGRCYPDRELYIRWLQVAIFMPSLQFSVPPWIYGDETVQLTRRLLQLRVEQRFIANMDKALLDARRNVPIVRPLWWLTNDNFDVGDQFMLGDGIMVAPVLKEGEVTRTIVLPSGKWRLWSNTNDSEDIEGPTVLQDFSVPLQQVAAFYLVD